MSILDRVTRLEFLPAVSLQRNPRNPRLHTETQRESLRAILETVGFAGYELAYHGPLGLTLIDGHLRQEEMGTELIPVLITDLDEQEADQLLLTFDQLSAAATNDGDALDRLRTKLGPLDDPNLEAILDSIRAADYALVVPTPEHAEAEPGDFTVTCPACGCQFTPP